MISREIQNTKRDRFWILRLREIGARWCWILLLSVGGWGTVGQVSAAIDEIHLFTVPTALDLDSVPGPDGFEARVYASASDRAKGIPITQGVLEVLMYDGVVNVGPSVTNAPLHVWSFRPADLKRNVGSSTLGVGYRFVLRWNTDVPKSSSITVVARWTPPKGAAMYSSTSSILVSRK